MIYSVQASYSNDVAFAARNVAFFLIPFAALFVLMTEVRWTPRVLAAAFGVVIAEAAVFALVGIGQFAATEIFWNPALERSNDFHQYFRVNSLFWDPNIYGRYLAFALVLVAAVVLWTRSAARILVLAALGAVVFTGLLFGFSQTSFISLLAGLLALCAMRYSLLWTAVAVPLAVLAVAGAILVLGGTSEQEDDAKEISSGRSSLIEGGLELARSATAPPRSRSPSASRRTCGPAGRRSPTTSRSPSPPSRGRSGWSRTSRCSSRRGGRCCRGCEASLRDSARPARPSATRWTNPSRSRASRASRWPPRSRR